MSPRTRVVITLVTDFGREGVFVGVMKGVIAGIAPQARVIDLTHDIPPFNIVQAAFGLRHAAPYFPEGTIHLAVVDPGVGTERKAVAVRAGGHCFVAPDNGLLAPVAESLGPDTIVEVRNSDCFLPTVSSSFHGRDVFAPVAAHLAAGVAIDDLGPQLAALQPLDAPRARREADGTIRGEVLWSDRFGNLITNIPATMLDPERTWCVHIGRNTIQKISHTYAQVDAGEPLAMIGSFGMLEIAVRLGNAAHRLREDSGTPVHVAPA